MKKNMFKTKEASWKLIGGGVAIIVISVLIIGIFGSIFGVFGAGAGMFNLAGDKEGKYDYTGSNVDKILEFKDQYNGTDINPTCYIYETQPDSWGNGRISLVSGYVDSEIATSGQIEYSNNPGTYYTRCQLSGDYDTFGNFEIPSSGDVTLSAYNDGGEEKETFRMYKIATLSTSNLDLGVSTTVNESQKSKQGTTNFVVADDSAYCLSEAKFQVDATYDFTASLTNGKSEEGIGKLKVTLQGTERTLYDNTASLDEFGSDNEYIWKFNDGMGLIIPENDYLDLNVFVTETNTSSVLGDGDGNLGNGEGFIDDLIFIDCKGTTATLEIVG